MLAYPEIAKPLLELILGMTIVIGMEHAQKDALSKTTRSDEDEVTCLLLQLWDIHGLIHVVYVLFHHRLEIRHAVWNLLYILYHS